MKTCSEKALEWNVTPRTVNAMCKNGRIQGAVKEKRTWLIPDDAEKPLDGRISTGKYLLVSSSDISKNTLSMSIFKVLPNLLGLVNNETNGFLSKNSLISSVLST